MSGMPAPCPFCVTLADPHAAAVLQRNEHVAVLFDAFPLAPGHRLVVPLTHAGYLSDLPTAVFDALFAAVHDTLTANPGIDWTVGVNDGPSAGQTIPHVHVHLVPRIAGDVPDPRGGVRWVLPSQAAYFIEGGSPAVSATLRMHFVRARAEAAAAEIWTTALADVLGSYVASANSVSVFYDYLDPIDPWFRSQPHSVLAHTATGSIEIPDDHRRGELLHLIAAAPRELLRIEPIREMWCVSVSYPTVREPNAG